MAASTDIAGLEESFRKFAIHGDPKASGQEMNGKNWAKLCKDCKVADRKEVTGMYFSAEGGGTLAHNTSTQQTCQSEASLDYIADPVCLNEKGGL